MRLSTFRLLLAAALLSGFNARAQVYTQDFSSGIPADWASYTNYTYDYVNATGGEANLFKQSDGSQIIILGTQTLNLANYKRFEIDIKAYTLNFSDTSKPELHFGVWTNPADTASFVPIHMMRVSNTNYQTQNIYLGGLTGNARIAFKLVGKSGHIIYIDNFKLYNDGPTAVVPFNVSNLTVSPAPGGQNKAVFSWKNPSTQADGGPLTDLDSIVVRANGVPIFTRKNPVIGGVENETIQLDSADFYKFSIIPYNTAGQGYVIFTDKQWYGLDNPGAPQHINIALSGNVVTLTWTPPIQGSTGGFFDGIINSYTITRADGPSYTIPGTQTFFTETLTTDLGSMNYSIQAWNNSGIGNKGFSQPIYYITPNYLLFENFWTDVVVSPNDTVPDQDFFWTSLSTTPNAYWYFIKSSFNSTDLGEMALKPSYTSSGANEDVRAISPIINTTGYPAVIIRYNQHLELANTAPYHMKLETTSDGGSTWHLVNDWNVTATLNEAVEKTISNSDVGSPYFQFAITMEGNAKNSSFVRIDNIRVLYQPTIDVRVVDFQPPVTVQPGDPVEMKATIENNSTNVTNCTATYTIRDRFTNAVVAQYPATASNMAVGAIQTLNFGTWTAVEGEYQLEVKLTANGDQNPANNTVTKYLNVFHLQPRDLVIAEEFTGTWCVYCPGAALGIADLYAAGKPIAAVAYHSGDTYETAAAGSRIAYYDVQGFPTVNFDGVFSEVGGDANFSVVNLYTPDVDARIATSAPLSINFNSAAGNNHQYKATVDVKSLSPIKNPDLKLYAIVTESNIPQAWQTQNKLDEVVRASATYPVNLSSKDATVQVTLNYTNVTNPANANVVFFVQDNGSKEILNGKALPLNTVITQTSEAELPVQWSVWPNPFGSECFASLTLQHPVAHLTVSLVDAYGKTVLQQKLNGDLLSQSVRLDSGDMPAGIYFMVMEADGASSVQKVSHFR